MSDQKIYIIGGGIVGILIVILILLLASNDKTTPQTQIIAAPNPVETTEDANTKLTPTQVALLQDDRYAKVVCTISDSEKVTITVPPKYKASTETVSDNYVLQTFVSEEKVEGTPKFTVDYMLIPNDDTVKLMQPPMIESFLTVFDTSAMSTEEYNELVDRTYMLFSSISYDTENFLRGDKPLECSANFSTFQTSLFDEKQPDLALPNGYYDIKFKDSTLRIVVSYHDERYVELFDKLLQNSYKLDGTEYQKIETEAMEEIDDCFKLFLNNTLNGDYSPMFEHLLNRD